VRSESLLSWNRLIRWPTRSSRTSYWVCEKSDGIRVLLVVLTVLETNEQFVYTVRPYRQFNLSLTCFLGRPAQCIQGTLRSLLPPS
jgi:hypothetical protein